MGIADQKIPSDAHVQERPRAQVEREIHFRERVRSTAERLKTNLLYSRTDAIAALWRFARDNGVVDQIGNAGVEAILDEGGL